MPFGILYEFVITVFTKPLIYWMVTIPVFVSLFNVKVRFMCSTGIAFTWHHQNHYYLLLFIKFSPIKIPEYKSA